MTRTYRWRKSSRSHAETACIELAHTLDAVRDSKNPNGPMLNAQLGGLITMLKSGQLDRRSVVPESSSGLRVAGG